MDTPEVKPPVPQIGGTAFITCTCASCPFIASGRTVDAVAEAIADHRAYAHPRVA